LSNVEPKAAGIISEEMKILASTSKGPKLMEEISSDTQIPLVTCTQKVADLIDLGVLIIEHDSDLYGHELVKYGRASRRTLA
jgi:predicted transcriptional regulator